ncbi:MAG: c-type cytochrome [Pseudomonadota bacterium]|nr:c-type cytochrome [Pseudomonadota bacterium]
MAIAIALILLVVGSIVFHFVSPWYLTPIASNWGMIDTTIDITFVVTGIVFVLVNIFTAYCIIKFRHKKGSNRKADYEPENARLESWLTIITSIGVAAMLAPGLIVWNDFVNPPEDAIEVEVVGQQWHWSFRLPGNDGQLGNVDIIHMSKDNPFGIDPEDPAGQDDVLIGDSSTLHLPLNQPTKVLLRSKDVLHDFAVPQFRIKMDLVPGMVTYAWFTPTKEGSYDILCEELCGISHHAMRGKVIVDNQLNYQEWLNDQVTFADLQNIPEGDPNLGKANFAICAACHGQNGEGMQALNAPKLTGQEPLYLKRQLKYWKEGIRGSAVGDIYGATMTPLMVTLPDQASIENVVAYIESLPSSPAEKTITGDVSTGRYIYSTCSACHGADGKGIWSMNAPPLAGMTDWYLARQLQNYKDGIRGNHPGDPYGYQMNMMVDILPDEQAINDVIAYINTL